MTEFWRQEHWIFRGLFLAIAMLLLFIRLLPLGSAPGALPGPDLLICVIMAWIVRRPDFLPMPLIFLVILTEDLILMRPRGSGPPSSSSRPSSCAAASRSRES
ncbi:MAG: hypothetical protein U1E58_00740 [Tabrizicola sp.]